MRTPLRFRGKDFTSLAGPYAASAFNQYVVGNNLLDSSLVPVLQFETGTGTPSGFAFVNETGFRTNAPAPSSTTTTTGSTTTTTTTAPVGNGQSTAPGVIQRVDMTNPSSSVSSATAMVEAPLLGTTASPFTRTIAPLANQSAIMNLTVSGVTVLPWNYDAAVAPPNITSVVNAGDGGTDIAPGGLISVYGTQLSPVNMATSEIPLPTALANSCLSVNGLPVPILFVSPNQVNAQMPFQAIGDVTLILRTPGGQSDNYNLVIEPNAPSVFLAIGWSGNQYSHRGPQRRQRTRDTFPSDSQKVEYGAGDLPYRPRSNFTRGRHRPAGALQPAGLLADPADSHPGRHEFAGALLRLGARLGRRRSDQRLGALHRPRRNVCPPRDYPGIGLDFDPGTSGGLTAEF